MLLVPEMLLASFSLLAFPILTRKSPSSTNLLGRFLSFYMNSGYSWYNSNLFLTKTTLWSCPNYT